ncbi:sugar ABC transporter substrate-binding protein [Pseudactinotalea sp. HY158]|uniref:ABC transporter substrate-binding protein n=1 Tax=Pseudactinotalea sp. HY158 TaxID=2654547 RepID=UPI00189246F9|nr:sugar ABC transporter substrate-binding protein [Pseudactinotalea sp. HY158]
MAAVATAAMMMAAGCSGSDGGSEGSGDGPVDVTYWLWQDDATDPTWDNLAEEFNKTHDDVQVTLENIPLDQYQNQVVTAVLNGTGPDAARSKDWWLGQFAPQGAIADLTPFVDSWDGKADVVDALWDTGRVPGDDHIYMLPHQYTTLYLYYRVDYFKEAGIEPPATQQEFLDAAKALTKDGRYGFDVRGGAGGQDQWLAWMYAGGAQIVDSDGNIVLDDDTGVEVNQRYLDLVTDLKATPPGSITADFAAVKTNFADGLTAMMIHHPGSLKEMQEHFGDKLGVIPVPTVDGQPGPTLGSMSGNVIMANSEKKEAAWTWISWLSEQDQMETMSNSAQGQLPVLQSVIDTPAYTDDPQLKVAVDAIPRAKVWPGIPGVAELAAKEWNPTIQQAFQGSITSDEALTTMADVLREGAE